MKTRAGRRRKWEKRQPEIKRQTDWIDLLGRVAAAADHTSVTHTTVVRGYTIHHITGTGRRRHNSYLEPSLLAICHPQSHACTLYHVHASASDSFAVCIIILYNIQKVRSSVIMCEDICQCIFLQRY